MFTIIIKNNVKGLFKRLTTKAYSLQMVQTPKFSFNIIRVKKPVVKFKKITALLMGRKSEFLLGKGVTIADNKKIMPPKNTVLSENLMYEMLSSALSFAAEKNKIAKKKVVLFDIKCEETKYLALLAKHFSNITVVTLNRKKYNKIAKKILNNNGIALVVTNYLHNLKEIALIVSPKNDNLLESKDVNAIYVGGQNANIISDHSYTNFTAMPIKSISRHIPSDVDEYQFLCALVNEYGYDNNFIEQTKVMYNGEYISDFSNNFSNKLGNN